MGHDALNRQTSNTNVFGVTLTYTLDANDHVTARQDGLGGLMTTTYDDVLRQLAGGVVEQVRAVHGRSAPSGITSAASHT
jgi:YD repeat-containing protein